MKDRLEEVRKCHHNGKTQEMFANFLGISVANLSSYETGRRNPSDAAIQLICQKCDVNEQWLRTGEGDMFVKKSKDEEIAEMLADIQIGGEDTFKHRFVSALAKLDESDWDSLEKLIDLISEKKDAPN